MKSVVYDEIAELPGKLVIQGKQAGAGLLGTLTGLADDETAVIIPSRDRSRQPWRPGAEPVGIDDLQAQFETFSYSAFRLEALQSYAGTGRDDQWITLLRASRRWGKTHQRVHVVTEPLTAAIERELTEGYEGNVAAGKTSASSPSRQCRLARRRAPAGTSGCSTHMAVRHALRPGRPVDRRYPAPTTRESVAKACRARDAALHRSTPWHAYIASRPDLQRRLAQ